MQRVPSLLPCLLPLLCTAGLSAPAYADDAVTTIHLSQHQFQPTPVHAPAGRKLQITLINDDAAPAEFESTDFHREKLLPPGKPVTLYVGPLEPGRYEFFDDFHPDNRGVLLVGNVTP